MFMGSSGLPSSVPSVTIEPGTMPTENALLSPSLLPLFILLRKHFKQEWLDMEFGMTAKIFYLFVFQLWWAIVKLAMEVEHLVFMFTSKAMKKWVVPLRKFELWILEDSLCFQGFITTIWNTLLRIPKQNIKPLTVDAASKFNHIPAEKKVWKWLWSMFILCIYQSLKSLKILKKAVRDKQTFYNTFIKMST